MDQEIREIVRARRFLFTAKRRPTLGARYDLDTAAIELMK